LFAQVGRRNEARYGRYEGSGVDGFGQIAIAACLQGDCFVVLHRVVSITVLVVFLLIVFPPSQPAQTFCHPGWLPTVKQSHKGKSSGIGGRLEVMSGSV